MVRRHVAKECNVEPAHAGTQEDREVGAVRHGAIDHAHQRTGARRIHAPRQEVCEPRRLRPGLEDERRPGRTACIHVDHGAQSLRQRVLRHEQLGAQEPALLTVGDDHQHVMLRLFCHQGTRNAHGTRHAGAIVTRSGRARSAVGMRHHGNPGRPRPSPRDPNHQVLEVHRSCAALHASSLALERQAERAEEPRQPIAAGHGPRRPGHAGRAITHEFTQIRSGSNRVEARPRPGSHHPGGPRFPGRNLQPPARRITQEKRCDPGRQPCFPALNRN